VLLRASQHLAYELLLALQLNLALEVGGEVQT
jgi:hypothetical protein